MAEVVLGFLTERIKEVILDLRSKLFDEDHTPQTIIGKDYIRVNVQNKVEIRRAPLINKVEDFKLNYLDLKINSIVAYGPFYHHLEQPNTWKVAKDEAWKHVLRNSDDKDDAVTTHLYFEAVRKVESEARAQYRDIKDSSMANLSSDDFVRMMVRDGCFLLQVALVVLGGSEQVMNYTPSDPLYIGKILEVDNQNDYPLFMSHPLEDRKGWIIKTAVWSMFLVGNQIPLLVLKALMRQSFFKNVVNRGIWEQPLELERWVLFEQLLVPAMLDGRDGEVGGISIPTSLLHGDYELFGRHKHSQGRGISAGFLKSIVLKPFSFRQSARKDSSKKANDLLHALWLLVTGSLTHSKEDDEVHVDDTSIQRKDVSQGTSRYSVVPHTVRSAAELKEVGVVFQKIEGTTIDRMRFQKHMFNATLLLPQIVVDKFHKASIFEVLFRSLIQYELINFGESKRIVCEYVQFMRGLIRTPEDAKILAAKGVIVVDPNQEKLVQYVFMRLAIPTVIRNHHSPLRSITDKLNNYTDPSMLKKLGDVLSFVVLLTLIQTVYSVLSYHLKTN